MMLRSLTFFSYFAWLAVLFLPIAIYITAGNFASNKKVDKLGQMISVSSKAYLAEQFWFVLVACGAIFFALNLVSSVSAVAFVLAFLMTVACGQVAMRVSVFFGPRVVGAACQSTRKGMIEAIKSGALASLTTTLMSLALIYIPGYISCKKNILAWVVGTMLGVSFMAMFAKLGGGIFTKGADIGADLVGKVESKLPEDDAKNPAVIADNVGDNVGDCAGMNIDLFETRVVMLLMPCLINKELMPLLMWMTLAGVLSSCVGLFMIFLSKRDVNEPGDVIRLFRSSFLCGSLSYPLFASLSILVIGAEKTIIEMICCILFGVVANAFVMCLTQFFTDARFAPIKALVQASNDGHGTNVIEGMSLGMIYAVPLFLGTGLGFLCFIAITGIDYVQAICMCGVAMISQSPLILAMDGYGPVVDNAGGIAEMSGSEKVGEVSTVTIRERTDLLDQAGNTVKATTKGYSIFVSAFAVACGLIAFSRFVVDCPTNLVLWFSGSIFGVVLVYALMGLAMRSVRCAGSAVVQEVRSQFAANPGILDGTSDPDYCKTVAFLTKYSLRAMISHVSITVGGILSMFYVVYYLCGLNIGLGLLSAMLMSISSVGLILAAIVCASGAAWDNAKKAVEVHEKGTPKHSATVTGDTVGDPYKDTVGPALNSFVKLTLALSMFLASSVVTYNPTNQFYTIFI